VSYGECELFEGAAGNTQYNTLWQSAASEGIAVFVAAGDSGAAACDQGGDVNGVPYVAEYGVSVSGLASTPYNTAVGGTDFNWCPFLSSFNGTACPASPSWSSANSTPTGGGNPSVSALGYVPEMPWNDTCTNPFMLAGLQALAGPNYLDVSGINNTEDACNLINNNAEELDEEYPYALDLVDTVGGGGGVSNCTSSDGSTVASCTGGYAKPSWQAGVTGIPSDGKRDLPDVSFFSSDGLISDSAYLICVEESGGEPCTYSTDAEPFASEVGGTSASTPPMAAVMALIDQKAGAPQGFANPELYKLAAKQTYTSCSSESVSAGSTSCYFNDIDAGPFGSGEQGTNAMPCDYGAVSGDSPDCKANDSQEGISDTVGILSGYSAGTGYDLATGLGSLNVANIVNAWPAVSGGSAATVTVTPAQTSILLTATLAVSGTVASSPSGGATPTGSVTITAGSYTATATLAGGSYSFTVPASSLGAGIDSINVSYGGSTTYSTASGQAVITVQSSGATFTLTGTAIAYTPSTANTTGVAPGASATAGVTVSAVNGYTGNVTLTCSLTTSPASASDAPTCTGGGPLLGVMLPGTTAAVVFSVTTTGASTTVIQNLRRRTAASRGGWTGAGGGAVLALVLFLGIPARRRSWRAMLSVLMLMAALGGMVACGGGGSGGGTTTETDPGTSAGTYVFTVQAVGTPSVSPSVSTTFTVVVN
jgi:hypothetical protein